MTTLAKPARHVNPFHVCANCGDACHEHASGLCRVCREEVMHDMDQQVELVDERMAKLESDNAVLLASCEAMAEAYANGLDYKNFPIEKVVAAIAKSRGQ